MRLSCRVEGVRRRDDILSLRDGMRHLSSGQDALFQDVKRHHDATLAQSQQRESDMAASLRELHDMVTRSDMEATHGRETLAAAARNVSAIQGSVSTIQGGLGTLLTQQADVLSSSQGLERALQSHIL